MNFIHMDQNLLMKQFPVLSASDSQLQPMAGGGAAVSRDEERKEELLPIPASERSFSAWDMASLWLGMVVNVPSYYLAGSLVELGMSWWQGVATIVAGNSILLLPLILTAHPGTRYGVPFPVLLRSAFGVRGAHIPTLLRSLVACGWCGIESWIGAAAILLLIPSHNHSSESPSLLDFCCFIFFTLLQLVILWKGLPAIRLLQNYSTLLLMFLLLWLLCWAYSAAGGFGHMLAANGGSGDLDVSVLLAALTASISSWSSVVINIPDFSRFARSQADQILGQLGLPLFMGIYTFAGLAITSSTEVVFGCVISNPLELLARIGGPLPASLGFVGITLATLTTNIPANFVASANAFVGLSPSTFSFFGGAVLTAAISVLFQPWRLIGSSQSFVYTWLVGYSAVTAPISGILLTDYYVLRRTELDVDALYGVEDPSGPYYFVGGYNVVAIIALVLAILPSVPGFLHKAGMTKEIPWVFVIMYDGNWFFNIVSASIIYWLLTCSTRWWKKKTTSSSSSSCNLLKPLQSH